MRSLVKDEGHTSSNRERCYLVSIAVIDPISISISVIRNFGLGSPNLPLSKQKEIHNFTGNVLMSKYVQLIIYLKIRTNQSIRLLWVFLRIAELESGDCKGGKRIWKIIRRWIFSSCSLTKVATLNHAREPQEEKPFQVENYEFSFQTTTHM